MSAPVCFGLRGVAGTFGDGEMGHEVVRRSPVPVLLFGWGSNDVARPDLSDGFTPGLHQTDAVGDVERLSEGVRMPGGAGTGAEADGVHPGPRRRYAGIDRIDPDVAGEHLVWALGGRRLGRNLHDSSFPSVGLCDPVRKVSGWQGRPWSHSVGPQSPYPAPDILEAQVVDESCLTRWRPVVAAKWKVARQRRPIEKRHGRSTVVGTQLCPPSAVSVPNGIGGV